MNALNLNFLKFEGMIVKVMKDQGLWVKFFLLGFSNHC
jgi:hypothetical protein